MGHARFTKIWLLKMVKITWSCKELYHMIHIPFWSYIVYSHWEVYSLTLLWLQTVLVLEQICPSHHDMPHLQLQLPPATEQTPPPLAAEPQGKPGWASIRMKPPFWFHYPLPWWSLCSLVHPTGLLRISPLVYTNNNYTYTQVIVHMGFQWNLSIKAMYLR